MARTKPAQIPEAPEVETRAYGIVPAQGGLWSMRTYLVRGDAVLAYEDTEPDERVTCLGLLLREVQGG